MATYRKSAKGIGEMLCMPGMVANMAGRANRVAARARATAPVETGEYADSFVVTSGIRPATGSRTARAYGRVTNTSDHAVFVEYGTEHQQAHHTLARALEAAGD